MAGKKCTPLRVKKLLQYPPLEAKKNLYPMAPTLTAP